MGPPVRPLCRGVLVSVPSKGTDGQQCVLVRHRCPCVHLSHSVSPSFRRSTLCFFGGRGTLLKAFPLVHIWVPAEVLRGVERLRRKLVAEVCCSVVVPCARRVSGMKSGTVLVCVCVRENERMNERARGLLKGSVVGDYAQCLLCKQRAYWSSS